ncbi:hypothetical protein BDZ91DRAFT_799720 [Kalaharituber pfeilii]|nr:hypothetical protein BDZ91DRAFT_799720 [Kalaharituber pfeilii]
MLQNEPILADVTALDGARSAESALLTGGSTSRRDFDGKSIVRHPEANLATRCARWA